VRFAGEEIADRWSDVELDGLVVLLEEGSEVGDAGKSTTQSTRLEWAGPVSSVVCYAK
jgi:hypothetical protein